MKYSNIKLSIEAIRKIETVLSDEILYFIKEKNYSESRYFEGVLDKFRNSSEGNVKLSHMDLIRIDVLLNNEELKKSENGEYFKLLSKKFREPFEKSKKSKGL